MQSILDVITPIKLLQGPHSDTAQTGHGCAMNVIAYLNGEDQITDNSPCVCVTVRKPLIWLNDYLSNDERQELAPYLLRAMGSATDDETVINERLVQVVQFANVMTDIAKRAAAYAAANGANAANVAAYAAYAAATAAATATAAYADYAAATANAAYAAYAVNNAVNNAAYAATAAAAAAAAAFRKEIKAAGFAFLDAVLPKNQVTNPDVLERAKNLAAICALAA